MTAAVEAVPGVWLDAAVLEELQPPCEGNAHGESEPPATWFARWAALTCRCGRTIILYCDACAEYCRRAALIAEGDFSCKKCRGLAHLAALERL